MTALSQRIQQLKDLSDDDGLDSDEQEFIDSVVERTGNGRAATLLTEAEANRVDEIYDGRFGVKTPDSLGG